MLDIDRAYIMKCLSQKGWSISELAKCAGGSRPTAYACLLHGKDARTETVVRWADALGIKPENILIQKRCRPSKWFDIDLVKLECSRVRAGLSKEQLAKEARISFGGLSEIYQKGWCKQETAVRLAEVLYLTVFELHRKDF